MRDDNSLSLGPGRPHELERLMKAQDPSRPVHKLTDLAELLQCPPGRALLDGAQLPLEDLGIIRRALQSGDRMLTVLGGDPSTGTLREVLKHPRAGWLPYPPDSEELSQLVGAPVFRQTAELPTGQPSGQESAQVTPPEPQPSPEPEVEVNAPALGDGPSLKEPGGMEQTPTDPHLAEIEAILSQPVAPFQISDLLEDPKLQPEVAAKPAEQEVELTAPPAAEVPASPPAPSEDPMTQAVDPAPLPEEADVATERTGEDEADATHPSPAASGATTSPKVEGENPAVTGETPEHEPAWFKDQVADLADIVQTIYSSTSTIEEGETAAPPGLLADSMRLVQFTRTLGFLAAPPARGEVEFDLGDLSEDLLRSAGAAADAPRFLLKVAEPLIVRGDKELLVQALDAILVLARLSAGPEGEVRLSGKKTPEGGSVLLLGFPRGPIKDLTPDEIVTPYALRAVLPDMGKNALRAASRIIEGQGGSLVLTDPGSERLQFELRLPPL